MKLDSNIGFYAFLSCLLLLSGCQTLSSSQTNQNEPKLALATASVDIDTPPIDDSNLASGTMKETVTILLGPESLISDDINPSPPPTLEEQEKAAMHQMATDRAKAEANKVAIALALEKSILKQAELKNHASAWYRLRQGMQLDSVDNSRVQAQLNWYLEHRAYLTRVMERAAPILPFILNELEKENLPTELALLPIVESAYQAFAYSTGRASGLWQIIPATGKHLGLKQNWWYDGRRDIIESTRAAIRYLVSLSGQFDGDWQLALASYNAGPGRIRAAIRHNKKKNLPIDFWHLTKIHKETTDYVPKLLALKELFGNPEKYELELFPVDNKHSYALVELDEQLDLALAADLAGLTINELYQLNPAFNRWATAPKGPHRLLLPLDKAESFKVALQAVPIEKRINWVRHKIKTGENLGSISRRYQSTIALIKSVNNIKGSQIRAGKYLMVPTATKSLKTYTMSKNERLNKIQNKTRSGTKKAHFVRSGQSLWTISRNYGVTTAALAKWNGMAPIDTLRIGQKLIVWTKRAPKAQQVSVSSTTTGPTKTVRALRYTIRKGDSLSRIADRFNILVSDIKRWNKIGKYIQPGQKLKLYVDITKQSG
ncbi:MAG: membrane-bound lytic murein transglycosylase D [Gammaproteobacteria bacterium]|jgi:membrane-bound lytic murein transglycosylase D